MSRMSFGNDFVDAVILVGGFLGGTGNDQRRARFVDQDRVHFVDDREVMPALHAILQIVLHVVAQVIEAEFVVRAVGDVGGVGGAALRVVQIVHDHADRKPQHLVDRAHPLRVAAGQVIVHGDDVHALAGERIQIGGQRGDERFSFARLHLRNFSLVQDDSADQLHVEMAHAERAAARFAHQRKRRHDRGLERLLAAFACSSGSSRSSAFQAALHFGAFSASVRSPICASERFFISGSSALIAADHAAESASRRARAWCR